MNKTATLALSTLLLASCSTPPKTTETQKQGGMNLIRYQYSKNELTKICKEAIAKTDKRIQALIDIPKAQKTFANTVEGLEEITADFQDEVNPVNFQAAVNTEQHIRDEANACEAEVGQYLVGLFTRRDLYNAWKVGAAEGKKLSVEAKRLKEQTARAFKKNGLDLTDKKLDEVRELQKKLTKFETDFSQNLNESKDFVDFSADDLEGVPESVLSRLQKTADGKYKVTTKTPDYVPVMENAKRGETRRILQTKYENRAADKNIKLLEDAILLREQIAKIMGFKTWADLKIDGRMAKDSKTVMTFLNGLKGKLSARNKKDLEKLLNLKKQLEPGTRELRPWDIAYYANELKKRNYDIDDEAMREYFPSHRVVDSIFKLYSTLLGVNFHEVAGADTWYKDVKLYEIKDAKTNEVIAHFYTDFTPRDGKYGHAAAFTLVQGRLKNGEYVKPISSIVANFNPPTADKPSLLSHDEVETFFHEFGHIMHQTLTKAAYQTISGTSVARDFVEAPSQMLENWAWDPKILKDLSGHYKDESKKLPDELIKRLIESRDFNKGYFYTRQLSFGLLDMHYNTQKGAVDTSKVYFDIYKDMVGIEPNREGHFQATFGHLMGGYDAGYYGYLWSEVYAAAMFARFEKEGLLSPKVGADYRKWILEKGDTFEALELVTKFLGKKPTNTAFYKMLGIK